MSLMESKSEKNPPDKLLTYVKYEYLLAGIAGGVTSTLVLHPLDLLKIRFAVDNGQLLSRPSYCSLGNAVSTIFREEGIRGLYRGATPNCWGAGASWGSYFLFYHAFKAYMSDGQDISKKSIGPGRNMLAAAGAGIFTSLLTNPIWVVKTRMCLQYPSTEMKLHPSKHYTGMFDALTKVYRYEGIPGMYKGLVPGLFGVSHGALQIMAYEELKKRYLKYRRSHLSVDDKLGAVQHITFAALSKFFAASLTYPYQVLRARLQDQHNEYNGVLEVIRRTLKYEGWRGFYKGLPAYLLHVTPNICIVFLIYEKVTNASESL